MQYLSRGLVVVALMGSITALWADEAKELAKSIQAGMNDFTKAVMRKDFTKMENHLKGQFSPKFVYTRANGEKLNLSEWMGQLKLQFSTLKLSKITLMVSKVKISGNKATSQETFTMSATMPNPRDSKKTSTLDVSAVSSSVWEKTAKGWMCISSKDLRETVKIDGKAVKM